MLILSLTIHAHALVVVHVQNDDTSTNLILISHNIVR